jgi:hypothetical protein
LSRFGTTRAPRESIVARAMPALPVWFLVVFRCGFRNLKGFCAEYFPAGGSRFAP